MKRAKFMRIKLLVIGLLVSLVMFGCSSKQENTSSDPANTSKDPKSGGTLRIADQSEGAFIGYPPKIMPVVSMRQAAPAIESLFRMDKAGVPTPWLATGYKNDVAAKTITLTLRKGVKFHDGTDFNAAAVKWNLEQHMAAKKDGAVNFSSIDVVDDSTVRINLKKWDSTILSHFANVNGMMISPTAFQKNGQEWAEKNPVGTGPFKFVSWEKDVRTVYERFDGYWQEGKPYLDRIEWRPVVDILTRGLSLKSNELDLGLIMSMKDAAVFEKDGFTVARTRQGSGVLGFAPDSANPKSPFADVRVRQAAQHAFNNEAIAKGIYAGEAEPAKQWIYKGHWGYNSSIAGYPYDPAKAKKLLAEAGYAEGFKTKITYITNADNDQMVAVIQSDLKAVGINAELVPLQVAGWFDIMLKGTWEGLFWAGISPNPDLLIALSTRYAGTGPYKSIQFPDDYKEAINNAVAAGDFETKQKYTQEAMKLMIDKHALLMVVSAGTEIGVSQTKVKDHGFYKTPNTAWWTPEDAWIEKK